MSEAAKQAEEKALQWLSNYHGSIDATALLLAHQAGQYAAARAVSLPDRETLAALIEPDAFNRSSKRYWNVHPDLVDHIRSNARVRADAVLAALSTQSAAGARRPLICNGSSACPDNFHTHGCFADDGNCTEPSEHVAQTVEGEVEWGVRMPSGEVKIHDRTKTVPSPEATAKWKAMGTPIVQRTKAGPWIEVQP